MLTSDNLYKLDNFKVHIGAGEHIGFCTCWNEPTAILKAVPYVQEKCALIGTLYSRQGINIMLRNLALNPTIRRLYTWGNGNLSQTKFGLMGKDALYALWKSGITDDRTISGTNFKLEKEIDLEILKTIIDNVELVDISECSLNALAEHIEDPQKDAYMEPIRFPDAEPEATDTFPSEEVGWVVRGKGVIDTWQKVVHRIMTYGTVKGQQSGSLQKELIGVTWVVADEDPLNPVIPAEWPQGLREAVSATQEAIEQYHEVFLSPQKPEGVSYTYGNRLMAYPNGADSIDQIEEMIIANFRKSPDTRRGVATTLVPHIDTKSDEPPCLTQLQFLQSRGALHALATFRSHDIFKAAIPNAFGLRKLQKRVCDELGFSLGCLQITSQSAHVYEADWLDAKKLVECAFWQRDPEMVFYAQDADPRGNLLIHVIEGEIEIALMSPEGAELWKVKGPSARYIQKKLGQLDLLLQPEHLIDIGMELQKAQIAKEKGLAYVQDRPLIF